MPPAVSVSILSTKSRQASSSSPLLVSSLLSPLPLFLLSSLSSPLILSYNLSHPCPYTNRQLSSADPFLYLAAMLIGNLYVIAAIAVFGGGLFGFDISSMSAIIGTRAYLCYFNQGDIKIEDGEEQCAGPHADVQGGITASMAGGSWLGALVSGFLSDMFGRKTSIQIGAVIW